ncbi:MAG TPA: aminotransferase class I/II-fold pyridoxal phosphate-dependent enzyme [Bacteroidales bacterium]|nr:aminotransferase class I/II-fold pyridoxal phosphate-dependent enzyme [Bacteroidales bacterium]HOH83073.1 aminotransferase class I/II-fold pyridoxal phosphate-dependent enzyme [Bacteroidales bacterium]HPB24688.1 aminotransferase class I/II-fold pyridoxal phosphate-dependent enzyme [Bacteroidales bacterium]HQN15485.1 aminotransferase class I/II-fold pyridoxal phosphate-dependent enzyme [Bacteroidales bacterium]HQP14985.1 aminotransferase class I/II-fold pyridoxal phosphate-dependent enzyme [B
MDISDIINHLGEDRRDYYGAVAPPVMRTSNFCFASVEDMRSNINREFEVPFYSRGNNPTVSILRKKMAALEKTEDALITASGCAAISTAVFGNLAAGDHAICVTNCYSWTYTLFHDILKKFGVNVSFIDGTRIEHFKNAITPKTRLIMLESPTSFMMELQDLKAVAALAKQHEITTIIDNSYATPLYQNPAELGIDIVVHSASKYLGGHSDLIAGVICGTEKMIRKLFSQEYLAFGGIITPDNAWLILRGLRTLPVRMKQISETTQKIVCFLEDHPKIDKVLWPFAKSYPKYELARQQMKGAGGLFSFTLKTKEMEKVDMFCNKLRRFLLACSWGGYESLVFPGSVLYSSMNNNKAIPFNLIRMYAGLEEPAVLIQDIEQALEYV